ncbi:hypothetical protein LCGC14_2655720 [marine sediment metagenome]|uniref:Uncharacterized protein n=1 Tax=marine sediment metagenome TaxID=412755 RepID=A0A0F9AFR5_9ZZZZ
MKEEIQQQVIDALQILADKLGTTAEFLWEVLLRQAMVEGVFNVFVSLLWTLIVVATLIGYRKIWVALPKAFPNDSDGVLLLRILLGAASALLVILGTAGGIFGSIRIALTCFVNPEYWALQEVLKRLGG